MALGTVGRAVADALGMGAEARERIRAPRGAFPWSARLPVGTLATDAVGLASLAIDLVAQERSDVAPPLVHIDRTRVAASFGSERLLRIDGAAFAAWAPLSGFWETGDGWVRTHGNYPHHGRRLARLVGVEPDVDPQRFAMALRDWSARELEDRAAEVDAIVGAVRGAGEWRHHPQGVAVAAAPIVETRRTPGAAARAWGQGGEPLAGIRVLDLTRVIAGPIAARDLALAGAEVLRVDTPAPAEIAAIHLDTAQGKRSTLLDLADPRDRGALEALLARADVAVTGYRPGALARFGLDHETLAARHPGLVTASVSAWGWTGPWAQRRGFDSIVQAVSGIATAESEDGSRPGALPVQALDHSTGHFLAAAIAWALAKQRRDGGSIDVRMSLARTAHALLSSDDIDPAPDPHAEIPVIHRRVASGGTLDYAPPVLAFGRAPADYREVGRPWGADDPVWQT